MPSRRDLANAIRALSMDAVQAAKSGHPGAPMGMADIAEVLWNDFLKFNPANPHWYDRDRFILSNGHGSMLLYSVLHLTGYELPIEELKNFRQLHSKTPGHPEYGYAPGVETTTGPLGQGLTNAVGLALAEKILAARFNRDGFDVVDHHTYVFAGDGCLMEGISHEACSFAGTQGLGKLIVFYDDNGISIDGEVHGWFTDDTPKRFEAYGWQVIRNVDGHDGEAVKKAIRKAKREKDKPTLICCKTIIGFGAPNKQGTADTHGAPLGDDEIAAARKKLGWPHAPFVVPDEVRAGWDGRARGKRAEKRWQKSFEAYRESHPALAAEFERRMERLLPDDWQAFADEVVQRVATSEQKSVATRKSSEAALDAFGPHLPELVGGSADLTGSNNTWWKGSKAITATEADGNYLFYGVREFGMTAIMNGLSLHGGFIPYGGTFLTFSDYARNAIRMAALMKSGAVFVYTHDSIGLGEDGPTHQSVEHAASLRLIPGLAVWRPCDTVETLVAWRDGIERNDMPSALLLTRQNLAQQTRTTQQVADIQRGGYVLVDCDGTPELTIIATGSEVQLAVDAAARLTDDGRRVRVVSMPNSRRFAEQDTAYQESVLAPGVGARMAIEAGVTDGWWRWVGPRGKILGLDRYGESAPAKDVFEYFGFTVDNTLKLAHELLA
ncbi:MAG: transketolase [Gammaproteobacteria bacterium]